MMMNAIFNKEKKSPKQETETHTFEKKASKVKQEDPSATDLERSNLQAAQAVSGDASSANEFNDEMRDLKEFKSMISEKTVPKSIKILRNGVVVVLLILIGLTSFDLAYFSKAVTEFKDGTDTVSNTYSRHNTMANINYNIRKLQLLANNIIVPNVSTYEADLRADTNTLLDSLRTISLSISDEQATLSGKGFANIESDTILTQSLVQSGIKNDTSVFSDAMNQYISHVTSANNAPLTSYSAPAATDSTPGNFYYIRRNGLGPLRQKSETNAGLFAGYYIDRTNTYDTAFKIVMIVAIVIIVISELILIPIVFSVHKTATKVLSLFGYIPISDINELAAKCEYYVANYLENHRGHHAYGLEDEEDDGDDKPSKTSRMGDKTYVELDQNHDGAITLQAPHNDDGTEIINASYLVEMSLEDSTRKASGLRIPETYSMKPVSYNTTTTQNYKTFETESKAFVDAKGRSKQNLNNDASRHEVSRRVTIGNKEEEKKAVNQDHDDGDEFNDRPQKLLNSKFNNRAGVVIQFGIIGILFIAYFAVDYVFDNRALNSIQNSFNQLELICERTPNIRFMNAFTLEVIAQGNYVDVYTYPNQAYVDYRVKYQSLALQNNNDLKVTGQGSLPSQFNNYQTQFNNYDAGDICAQYYGSNSTLLAQCQSISGGLLTKGLTLSVTRMTQISDDLVTTYNSTTNQTQVINSDEFLQSENILEMIAPVMDSLRSTYQDSQSSYININWVAQRVKFGLFISLLVFGFFMLWIPYLRGLQDKIFRTKGMLNMIPMDLITKNTNLRNLFANSGDILQAVK